MDQVATPPVVTKTENFDENDNNNASGYLCDMCKVAYAPPFPETEHTVPMPVIPIHEIRITRLYPHDIPAEFINFITSEDASPVIRFRLVKESVCLQPGRNTIDLMVNIQGPRGYVGRFEQVRSLAMKGIFIDGQLDFDTPTTSSIGVEVWNGRSKFRRMKRGEDLTDFMVINKELLKFKIEGPIQRMDTRACLTLESSRSEFWERNLQKNQEEVSADENPTSNQPSKGQRELGNEINQHHSDSDERKRSKSPKKGSSHSQSKGTRIPPSKNYSSNHRTSKSKSYKRPPIRHNEPSKYGDTDLRENLQRRKDFRERRGRSLTRERTPPREDRTPDLLSPESPSDSGTLDNENTDTSGLYEHPAEN